MPCLNALLVILLTLFVNGGLQINVDGRPLSLYLSRCCDPCGGGKDRHGTDSIGDGYKCGMVEFGRRCMKICGEWPRRDGVARVVRISNNEFAILVSLILVALAAVIAVLVVATFADLRIVPPAPASTTVPPPSFTAAWSDRPVSCFELSLAIWFLIPQSNQ